MARTVGFDPEAEKYTLDEFTATYENVERKLVVDITNFNFTYESFFEDKPMLFENTIIPEASKISEAAKAFLRQMDAYYDVFAQGDEKIILLHFDDIQNELKVVENPVDANVVEVLFTPSAINGSVPMVPPSFYKSQNYVIMIFKPEENIVIKAQVKHFPIDMASGYEYPIKEGLQAWDELLAGKGAIVSAGQNTNKIIIRDMFLGYYYPDTYQPYLQPVFVFLGDNNFAAYVDAVQDEYIKGGDDAKKDGDT